ncbi:MAG TPA: PaaI family thioesterase [Sphingorhabdus sp.]|jgi:uncharacterized protein (TIGR00369 family)|uniref:PaaI family thioesterase n=1 Tax=Sphingorhabdus sp. TaxID=1902408 RepID=UPI002C9496FF|nr:PaaI family thioesterase [Sphingorhabdus sp.]HMT42441.1 PaaI family thioesterase [Sphingorhabdus sp.]HMU20644.1 PaaI family thioesterase [Sphingorhabdus sp.]
MTEIADMSMSMLARGQAALASQPFSALIGTRLSKWSADGVELELEISDKIRQQHGFVHGGVVAYMADNALTFAGAAKLAGTAIVTGEMKINYIRPAVAEKLIARATAISGGSTQSVARCEVYCVIDGVEKLCAAAQGTINKLPERGEK